MRALLNMQKYHNTLKALRLEDTPERRLTWGIFCAMQENERLKKALEAGGISVTDGVKEVDEKDFSVFSGMLMGPLDLLSKH